MASLPHLIRVLALSVGLAGVCGCEGAAQDREGPPRADPEDAARRRSPEPLLVEPEVRLGGSGAGEAFGSALAGPGDLDGDGFDDVVAGGPEAEGGVARWYRGGVGGPSARADWNVAGAVVGDELGAALAGGGDVDGDGGLDLLVGAPGVDGGRGELSLWTGSGTGPGADPMTTLRGAAAGDRYAQSLAGAGDVDGDGYDDVIVGAPGAGGGAGRVYVHRGGATGLDATAILDVGGEGSDALGEAVAGADVDGDGWGDVFAAAPGANGGLGEVRVWLGSATGPGREHSPLVPTSGGGYGQSLVGAGDLDRDGFDEVVVGAPDSALASVWAGSSDGPRLVAVTTLAGGDGFGAAVAGGIDYNGDGWGDLVVGAPDDGDGTLSLFEGRRGGVDEGADATRGASAPGEGYGEVLGGLGDLDADGYGDLGVGLAGADGGVGEVEIHLGRRDDDGDGSPRDEDCDDLDPGVYPGASEEVGDGVDSDCDGAELCYVDLDGDGWRDGDATVLSADAGCGGPGEAGAGRPTGDCDDTDATVNPGSHEIPGDGLDRDCDGLELCFVDADGDHYRPDISSTVVSTDPSCDGPGEASSDRFAGDCDDTDPEVHPDAVEIVGDAIDENCNGVELCFQDVDEDGYRSDDGATVVSREGRCGRRGEALETEPGGDCDDGDPRFHPGATEADCADPNDYNCDGSSQYADRDADGAAACVDCDDADPGRYPGADELCNGIDDDCDGDSDERAVDAGTWYADEDADGYTSPSRSLRACEPPDGYRAASAEPDCDDAHDGTHPGAEDEPRDGIDQDCDGEDAPLPPDTGPGAPAPGCGCAAPGTAGGRGAVALLLGLVALLGRRPRRARVGSLPTG